MAEAVVRHTGTGRVRILLEEASPLFWSMLEIAESTWWKVSNGVERSLVGKAYRKGARSRAEWHFHAGEVFISSEGEFITSFPISDVLETES